MTADEKREAIDLLMTAIAQLYPRDVQPTDHVRRLIGRAMALMGEFEEWDAASIKPPGWHHVEQAFYAGAMEARANPDADEALFKRAADGWAKRVFEEVDPVSERMIRTEAWAAPRADQEPAR